MRIRPIEPEDLEFLYTIENDPYLWDATDTEAPFSRFALKQYLASLRPMQERGELRMAIDIEADARHRTVGLVELTDINYYHARAEVGIALLKEYRGQGLGTRALQLIEQLALKRLRLHQLYAYVAESNSTSAHLFEKGGYAPSAHLAEWKYQGKGYENVVIYQKLFKK